MGEAERLELVDTAPTPRNQDLDATRFEPLDEMVTILGLDLVVLEDVEVRSLGGRRRQAELRQP